MPFNRGMLMNVGFQEAMKADIYDCAIFHDIDLIPEDDRNDYSCPSSPRHMSTAVDTMKYKLGYKKLFGGVEAFWPEHYRKVNGFPNRYWGWGGEDDDLYVRIVEHSLTLTRPAHQIGRYTMLKHGHKKSDKNPDRHAQLQQSQTHLKTDGLSVLKYDVISSMEHPLYTMIGVKLGEKRWSLFG
ncbi:predicted protein [Nematostella vectensis]|uniref:Uncharacterized protein n=2 Tax=Nematostella vectensis TaxID=45351 RepID=A7SGJ5_NEMVE|nr:predicted protein [Nematostella vectensis]|eukprot:XP_001629226.1 predicted protein [Nematostella vectensis]